MRRLLAVVVFASSAAGLDAHEFWIEPHRYVLDAGEPIVADLRVGETFEGVEFAYFPNRFRRFEVVNGAESVPVEGRLGDRPALRQAPAGPGLNVVVLEMEGAHLTYDSYDTFEGFVTHKDAKWVLEEHDERGLPREGVTEVYSRYAKSLVAAGAVEGEDRALGLEVEIVALANPYADDIETMPVRVLYRGAPRADAQVEVFARAPGGDVAVKTLRTDAAGEAQVPVSPGYEYLLDSVVLRPAPAESGAMWESLWAALTFRMPE